MFCVKIQNVYECFGSKSNTFWMFWVETQFFLNVLAQNKLHFNCKTLYLLNVLWKKSILFQCFGSKSDTFQIIWLRLRCFSNGLLRNANLLQMFWTKIKYSSSMLDRNQLQFKCLGINLILFEYRWLKFN